MAGSDPGASDPQTWIDLLRVWAPGVTPAALLGTIVGWFKYRADRKAKLEGSQADRVAGEAKAEAAERKRLDDADAAQLSRHTAEIARKDAEIATMRIQCKQELDAKDREIAWWKRDSAYGWAGATRAMNLAHDIRHKANNLLGALMLLLNKAGAPLSEKLDTLPDVPDIETLTGRNGKTDYL